MAHGAQSSTDTAPAVPRAVPAGHGSHPSVPRNDPAPHGTTKTAVAPSFHPVSSRRARTTTATAVP